ncbi:alpha carbonic anhydrase 6-like [Quercus suber]|uniref:alpha carbonic anhydrase 6-like n=1 Tax=Quercus suber TaxID=58331 RepID=UPI0032DF5833
MQLKWASGVAGSIEIIDIVYYLQQCHWHSPSEHSINGIKYELELHMVHMSLDIKFKDKVVVGVLYNIGQPDPFLAQINPTKIQTGGYISSCYPYAGSLTVPPCCGGVLWIIDKRATYALFQHSASLPDLITHLEMLLSILSPSQF